jgi:glycerophosphoryl diester phosphodiesterase
MNRFLPLTLWIIFFLFLPRYTLAQQVIAHRGAPKAAPENTLSAFKKAIELGADILELDVHQTKDSQLVVIHDATVDRTTNGKGRIADYTVAELRRLDAGSWFAPAFTGEKIPLLEEVLDATPDSISLLIEIKHGSETYPGIEKRVVQLTRENNATGRVIVKSFDDEVLQLVRRLAPEIPRLRIIVLQIPLLNIIIERGISVGEILDYDVQYLQLHWFGISKSFVGQAHSKGYKVFAWDVHDEKRMREMIEKGVDGIETDYPDRLKHILREDTPGSE